MGNVINPRAYVCPSFVPRCVLSETSLIQCKHYTSFQIHVRWLINLLTDVTQSFNPLPTTGNSLKKQKSMYKVLTPSIKPYKFLWLMGAHDAYMRHWLVKG